MTTTTAPTAPLRLPIGNRDWHHDRAAEDTTAAGFAGSHPYSLVALALFADPAGNSFSSATVYGRMRSVDRSVEYVDREGDTVTFWSHDGTWHDMAGVELFPRIAAIVDRDCDRALGHID